MDSRQRIRIPEKSIALRNDPENPGSLGDLAGQASK